MTVGFDAMLSRRGLLVNSSGLMLGGRGAWADATADALVAPQDRVILTVTGAIGATNAPERAEFDRTMLEQLGMHTVRTWTPWTEGVNAFAGTLGRCVMDAVAAKGGQALATALNDFEALIPLSDFQKYDVLLATSVNGAPLAVRDKGPIWVIYPWSDHPELDDLVTRRKSVWQLRHLHVQ